MIANSESYNEFTEIPELKERQPGPKLTQPEYLARIQECRVGGLFIAMGALLMDWKYYYGSK